jgi:ATP-dependent helicase/nuclease subunit B
MADALAQFLDAVEIEEPEYADPPTTLADRVETLVEGDFAAHWRRSARFLAVATRRWPQRLHDLGLVDAATRRVKLLRLLAERWERTPPATPLVAAGSTGTTPAAADLLAVIAATPQGCVVLPGLDKTLSEDAWVQIDDQHPQGALRRLLDRLSVTREAVCIWSASTNQPGYHRGEARQRVINEALRPAEATADWLRQIGVLQQGAGDDAVNVVAEGLDGLSLAVARTEEEAATAAALLLREALETPEQTCALITPDQALARRVSAKLARWGVEADSSAGAPLARFPAGVLMALVARASVEPVSPRLLLGILKHPFVRLGLDDGELAQRRSTLERLALRGPRPRDWAALYKRLAPPTEREEHPDQTGRREAAADLARALQAALDVAAAPFAGDATAPDAARALTQAIETLCTSPAGSTGSLWSGGAGDSAATLLAGLIDDGAALPPMDADGFAALLNALLEGETVRTGGASHPRLRILGAIEARLVRADRIVLAGLEEGVWPQAAPIDPFLSRSMRKALGLPPPERRIGLSAHDFAQAACAPKVVLLHTERRGGQPTVQSRWLWRLHTLAQGANATITQNRDVTAWAAQMDAPASEAPRYAPRPAPTPPVNLRPRSLYVTRIERWLRDPYAIYAQRILRLDPMERPDESAEARARGNAVHKALHRLVETHPHLLPEEAETIVETLMLESFDAEGFHGAALARERPNIRQAARFIVGWERKRRVDRLNILVERTGALSFQAPGGAFTVKARADRLEILDGGGAVLDFKTGQAPTKKQIETGFSPQLTLTGAILAEGGFIDAGPTEPVSLAYIRVTGRRTPGETIERAGRGEAATLSAGALAKLKRRVAQFDEQSTPYPSWAAPQYMLEFGGDYDHLARVWEWAVMGEDETIVAPVA